MDDQTPVSHIHWISRLSCGYSVFATLVFLIQLICQLVPPQLYSQLTLLYQILYLLQSSLLEIFLFIPLPLFFLR